MCPPPPSSPPPPPPRLPSTHARMRTHARTLTHAHVHAHKGSLHLRTCTQPHCVGSWDGGRRIAGAAAAAVERVNRDKTLLHGWRLEYSWTDSGCSAQQGLVGMGKLLREASRVDALIGPIRVGAVIGPGPSQATTGLVTVFCNVALWQDAPVLVDKRSTCSSIRFY